MRRIIVVVLLAALALTVQEASADDLTGSDHLLCAVMQATYCLETGECGIDLPWNLNIPEFIEIDLAAKQLSTTRASGKNRSTAITHLSRQDETIVLQGFEMGRAYSFVISEGTGLVTATVATEGRAVAVFGACTPLASPAEANRE